MCYSGWCGTTNTTMTNAYWSRLLHTRSHLSKFNHGRKLVSSYPNVMLCYDIAIRDECFEESNIPKTQLPTTYSKHDPHMQWDNVVMDTRIRSARHFMHAWSASYLHCASSLHTHPLFMCAQHHVEDLFESHKSYATIVKDNEPIKLSPPHVLWWHKICRFYYFKARHNMNE